MNKVVAANISGLWNPTMDPIKAWDWTPSVFWPRQSSSLPNDAQTQFGSQLRTRTVSQQQLGSNHPISEGERIKNMENFTLCSSTCWLKHKYCGHLCFSQIRNLAEVEGEPLLCRTTQVQTPVLPSGHFGSSQEKTFLKHIPVGMQHTSTYQKHSEQRLHWNTSLGFLNPSKAWPYCLLSKDKIFARSPCSISFPPVGSLWQSWW